MSKYDYWEEAVSLGADACGLELTSDQLKSIAESVEGNYDNIDIAFYHPSASDMAQHEEREWKRRHDALQKEFDEYRGNAEAAVKQALRQRSDAMVSIGKYGEVHRYDGRTSRIQ